MIVSIKYLFYILWGIYSNWKQCNAEIYNFVDLVGCFFTIVLIGSINQIT